MRSFVCKYKIMEKTIFKIRHDNEFTIVCNKIFNNPKLSWRAKGLLSYLLSKPENWSVYVNNISKDSSDGITSTSSGMNELIKEGYISKQQTRSEDGKFNGYIYRVYENPGKAKDELAEIRETVFGKPPTTKTNKTKKTPKGVTRKLAKPSIKKKGNKHMIVSFFIGYLKKAQGLSSLDDTIKNNRFNSFNLIKYKIKPLYEQIGKEPTDEDFKNAFIALVDKVMKDSFHRKNATSIKYLYNNFNKIIKL